MTSYAAALARMHAPLPDTPSPEDLVRYATLAANAHNTQPWRFVLRDGGISIRPDFTRRTPVADPDDHHLYVSLGCAAETLAIAARARGLGGEVAVIGGDPAHIDICLTQGPADADALVEAIPHRQCTRCLYDGSGLDAATVDALTAEVASVGATAVWIAAGDLAELTELVIQGNSAQMRDPAFVSEIKSWIRFNPRQAAETGDGLFAGCTGNPSAPAWLGRMLFDWFYSAKTETEKYRRQLASSAGCFVIATEPDAPPGWIAAGRAYQRLALRTTAMGLKNAFVNQAVEHPESRSALAGLLGLSGERPNLVLRIGHAAPMPVSLRRPAVAVID